MKIKSLLIVCLSFFSVISVVVYCIFVNQSMTDGAQKQYSRMISWVTEGTANDLNTYLDTVEKTAALVANDKVLASPSGLSGEVEAAQAYCGPDTGINRIIGFSGSGKMLFNTDNKYTPQLSEAGVDLYTVGTAYISDTEQEPGYEVVVRVQAGDASMLVYFSDSSIKRIMSTSVFPTNGRVTLVDPLGGLLDADNYVGKVQDITFKEYETVCQSVISGASLSQQVNFEIGKNARIAYTIPAGDSGWYVAALAESDSAYAYSNSSFGTLSTTAIFLLIFLMTIYIVLVITLTKPLGKIEDTLIKISRGDHDVRLEIMGRNEYGDITRGFNEVIDNITVSERRYRTIVEMSDNIVFEWSFKSNEILFSSNFNKKFSYRAPSDHYSDSFLLKCKVHPDDNSRYRADLEKLSKGEEFHNNEYRWKNIYGDYIWISISTATIRDKDNEIVKIVGVISDIDRAKKSESVLMERVSYDSLTGVCNRETIENIIDTEINKLSADSEGCAILFVDVDDFKNYNDQYSHATGDQVLKFTSDTLSNTVKEFGFVGRYGGDEFVVFIRNCKTNSPTKIAQELLTTLKNGFTCDSDDHLSVSVSIGISIVTDSSRHVDEIIAAADEAMYHTKKNGKSSFTLS